MTSICLKVRTDNEELLALVEAGRCLSMCGEWAKLAIYDYNIINIDQFDNNKINEGQTKYEVVYQNEKKLLEDHFNIKVEKYQTEYILPNQSLSAQKLSRNIANYLLNGTLHIPQIVGIRSVQKSGGYGHAIGGRSYISNSGNIIYEFIDPTFGIWESSNLNDLENHITKLLVSEYKFFEPNKRNEYNITKISTQIPPKLNSFLNAKELEPKTLTIPVLPADIPSKYQKQTLCAISSLLAKDKILELGIPCTKNKMAKLKYKEFLFIYSEFCKIVTPEQIVTFCQQLESQGILG